MSEATTDAIRSGWLAEEPLTWTTKDGRKIMLPELGDSHLLNILRLLRRNALARCVDHTAAIMDGRASGDGAQMALEAERERHINATWRDFADEQWHALYREATSRDALRCEAEAIHSDDLRRQQIAAELRLIL